MHNTVRQTVPQYDNSVSKKEFTYTVNHKKGGSTFVTITLENVDRFL